MGKQLALYSGEAYSEPCQASKMKLFVKIVNNFQQFSQKAPSWIFDKVLNMPLLSTSKTKKPNKVTNQDTSSKSVLETLEKP